MSEYEIQMIDLRKQYLGLKEEINRALLEVAASGKYINGPQVKAFEANLASYLDVPHVIPCGNGTDALQIALMALQLNPGDEVIVPAFAFAAAAEVTALLGMIPVPVDVDPHTFNIDPTQIIPSISRYTRAIVAVHLFGQSCNMEAISAICKRYKLFLIEDNAQSLGAEYRFGNGTVRKTGTIGDIGTTSFFPTKPLGCFGDGGALMTSDPDLAQRCRMITTHGQKGKYYHKIVGCNSRLDTLQAAILDVKLKYFDVFTTARIRIARRYDEGLRDCNHLRIPEKASFSTHIYHQYTVLIDAPKRDILQKYLHEKLKISSVVYYPYPTQVQEAFRWCMRIPAKIKLANSLCESALSLPIYPEMTESEQDYIIEGIKEGLAR